MGDTEGHPCSVLGIIEDTHSLISMDEKIGPSEDFSKSSELRSVVATRSSSEKRRMTRISRDWTAKHSNNVDRRNGGNSPAGQIGAVSLVLQTSISEESPARSLNTSHSGSGTAGRQNGEFFVRLG